MVRTIVFTTALLVTAATAASVVSAQIPKQPPPVASPLGQGDEKERAACHPDVVRFCKQLIKDDNNNDIFAILSCLQTNRTKISRACNEVLASHGQ
jgi:hypothetical protein